MNFPFYFSKKIAFSKNSANNLSKTIIFIGRISVALGIIVSLITVSTGLGSKLAIKERVADFSGHITLKTKRSNASFDSSPLDLKSINMDAINHLPEVAHTQSYVSVNGILRTDKNFAGIIYKGIGKDFDHERFKKFLVAGTTPKVTEVGFNGDITISEKISKDLGLKLKDSIVAIFSKENQNPFYRKFRVVGIYKTDIKMIDDFYVIGGINHARKILGLDKQQIGGKDIFLKNLDDMDEVFPKIDKLAGYNNYAEKSTDKFPKIVEWINIFDINIGLIIGLMLLVVIINIVMVLLILIIERTNSIGLLKTLGADNAQIRTIFINYTLLIMVPGLVFGNIIGMSLLLLQKYFGIISLNPENYYVSTVPVNLNPLYLVGISIGILVISALALIVPSYLVSKISPVKSIKYN